MRRSVLEIYALAVCFVTVVCLIVSLGIGIYSIVEVANPAFTLDSHDFLRHQSNDAYWSNPPMIPLDDKGNRIRPPEQELTRQRLESYTRALRIEQRGGLQTLTKVFIVILIDLIVFGVHWRLGRRARNSMSSSQFG